MIRRAIVNVAVGGWYPSGQQRLFDSLEERGENATRLFWRDCYPPGSPTHEQAPYAFKVWALERARELGFDCALWLDASCWARKDLRDIWARLDEAGYYLEADGHVTGEWISDGCLHLLGISRDEAMEIPLVEGKCLGLDFHDATAVAFLAEWRRLAEQGGFAGSWHNRDGQVSPDPRCHGHRHDISCASPLAWRFGMGLQPVKRVWFPAAGDPPDHVCVLAQGM